MSKYKDTIIEMLDEYFQGDTEKTKMWLATKNPAMGNIVPNDLILVGREEKLAKWIMNRLEGNL